LDWRSRAIEETEERIAELPRVSKARLLVLMPRPDSFFGMAERGLFVYDWSDVHRTRAEELRVYELVAIPENPIKVDGIPEELALLAAEPRLDAAFANEARLDVARYMVCRQPE
jgi:hypothetical protein